MASRQDDVNFTGAFKYLCRDLNGRRVQCYECAFALANSQRGGRHCSSHLLPCCDIVILGSNIDVSRLFYKHGLSEYEVFALLMTWQHCNTAALYHTHSSGRPRVHLQLTLFVVKETNKNQTQMCLLNGSLQRSMFRFVGNHQQAVHSNFVLRIHVEDPDH